MATTPRYAGTTASTAATYVRDAVGDDAFLRVFDLDGDGAVATASQDEKAFVRAVCAAETEVDEVLAASHGTPFTGTIPDSVREIVALRCLWCAVRMRPSMKDEARAPYRVLYKDTDARLARIAADNKRRIPETGTPRPTSSLSTSTTPLFWGDPNDPDRTSGF